MVALSNWNKFSQITPACSKCGQILQTIWDDALTRVVDEFRDDLQKLAEAFFENADLTPYVPPRIRKPASVKRRRTPVNKRHRAIRLAGRFR